MSWDWVKWDEDTYLSSSGASLCIETTEAGAFFAEYCSKSNWIVQSDFFPTKEEARAAMMEFIERCDGGSSASKSAVGFPTYSVVLKD